MKRDFNAWLASLGAVGAGEVAGRAARVQPAPTARDAAIKFGQAQLDISDEMDVDADRARWEADRARDVAGRRHARHRRGDARRTSWTRCCFPAPPAPRLPPSPATRRSSCRSRFVPNTPGVGRPGASGPAARRFPPASSPKPSPFGVSFTGTALPGAAVASSWPTPSNRRRSAGFRRRLRRERVARLQVAPPMSPALAAGLSLTPCSPCAQAAASRLPLCPLPHAIHAPLIRRSTQEPGQDVAVHPLERRDAGAVVAAGQGDHSRAAGRARGSRGSAAATAATGNVRS